MRFWSTTGTLVVLYGVALMIIASELGEAMFLLPIIMRRTAARRHLSEKLLNEVREIDIPNLSGQSIRRRSTTTDGSDNEDVRQSRGVAATTPQTDFSAHERQATRLANRTETRKNENSVAPLLKDLNEVDILGDSDWLSPGPPKPRRQQRNCEAKMMAGPSGVRILGKFAKCSESDGSEGDGKLHSETEWKLEGPITDYGDFYLKQKPEAQKFTADVENLISEMLEEQRDRSRPTVARASLVRT